jgi:hypothetical protein
VRPNAAQRKQEDAIHQTFKMRCEPHPHICEMLLGKTGEQP